MKQDLQQLCTITRRLVAAGLLDFSGGNVSVRCDEACFISPRFASSLLGWELSPDDLVELPLGDDMDELPGDASREGWMHYELYRLEHGFKAIVHTHQRDLLAFALAPTALTLPAPLESLPSALIPLAEYAPPCTRRLAERVQRAISLHFPDSTQAAALMERHGAVVAAESLPSAASILAALANAAYVQIARGSLDSSP